jgi:hypothetical protein
MSRPPKTSAPSSTASAIGRDYEEEPVIVALGPDDHAAQVKHWKIQQVLLDEIEQVRHASGSAVAIAEGMDRFEPVMLDREATGPSR